MEHDIERRVSIEMDVVRQTFRRLGECGRVDDSFKGSRCGKGKRGRRGGDGTEGRLRRDT